MLADSKLVALYPLGLLKIIRPYLFLVETIRSYKVRMTKCLEVNLSVHVLFLVKPCRLIH